MKSLVSVVTALLFALHASLCAAASVQVLSMKGSVTGRAEGAAETFLKEGDVIGSKWMVTTGRDSNVVLRFDDGQLVALQSSSTFRIDSYEYDKTSPSANRVWVSLSPGGLRAITGLVANTNRSAFTLRTSTATIGVRGTELMTVYFQGLYTQVVDGIVAVSTVAGTESASAGQTVLVTSSTAAPVTVDPGAFPEGLFYELRGIQMPAPVAKAGGGGYRRWRCNRRRRGCRWRIQREYHRARCLRDPRRRSYRHRREWRQWVVVDDGHDPPLKRTSEPAGTVSTYIVVPADAGTRASQAVQDRRLRRDVSSTGPPSRSPSSCPVPTSRWLPAHAESSGHPQNPARATCPRSRL